MRRENLGMRFIKGLLEGIADASRTVQEINIRISSGTKSHDYMKLSINLIFHVISHWIDEYIILIHLILQRNIDLHTYKGLWDSTIFIPSHLSIHHNTLCLDSHKFLFHNCTFEREFFKSNL